MTDCPVHGGATIGVGEEASGVDDEAAEAEVASGVDDEAAEAETASGPEDMGHDQADPREDNA